MRDLDNQLVVGEHWRTGKAVRPFDFAVVFDKRSLPQQFARVREGEDIAALEQKVDPFRIHYRRRRPPANGITILDSLSPRIILLPQRFAIGERDREQVQMLFLVTGNSTDEDLVFPDNRTRLTVAWQADRPISITATTLFPRSGQVLGGRVTISVATKTGPGVGAAKRRRRKQATHHCEGEQQGSGTSNDHRGSFGLRNRQFQRLLAAGPGFAERSLPRVTNIARQGNGNGTNGLESEMVVTRGQMQRADCSRF